MLITIPRLLVGGGGLAQIRSDRYDGKGDDAAGAAAMRASRSVIARIGVSLVEPAGVAEGAATGVRAHTPGAAPPKGIPPPETGV